MNRLLLPPGFLVATLCSACTSAPRPGNNAPSVLSPIPVGPTQKCTADPMDIRGKFVGILKDPLFADWATVVGLADADTDDLILIEDDAICGRIWTSSQMDTDSSFIVAFFKLGDLYIVTEYPDPSYVSTGHAFTRVLDERFKLTGPVLAW